MKSKFFLLGLCALALAACSIDEVSQVNDTNAVNFKVTATTRATVATTNNIDAFTVWAWETAGNDTSVFMSGVTAEKDNENTFSTDHPYYWPGGTVDFYAFIPAVSEIEDDGATAHFGDKITPSNEIIEGETPYTYDGYVATATIVSPSDISVDVHVPSLPEEEIDLCYAVTLGQSAGTVGLNFRHALSQVVFKARNTNAAWNVDIEDVTLCCVYKEGTYTLPVFETGDEGTTDHNSTTAKRGAWTGVEESVKGRFYAGIAGTTLEGLSDEAVSITTDPLMLIPQTVVAWDPAIDPTNTNLGAYIRITCNVTDDGEQIWPNYTETDGDGKPLDYAEITVPLDVDWIESSKYTYTIVFGEGLGYYAPDDPNDDLDGTPVLVPISFTVDIDDFGNTDDVDVSTEPEPKPLILEYTTTEANTLIQLPIASVTNAKIKWGDGATEVVDSDFPSHTYSDVGTYYVYVSGTVESLSSYYNGAIPISGKVCLTAVKQWGDTGLTSLDYAFADCSGLTSLPDGPGPFENVTTALRCFYGCSSLTTVPENIFSGCTAVTSFSYCFYGCSSLTTVPENIFSGCTAVTNFMYCFAFCYSLTTVPENIFSGCTAVTNFIYCFAFCYSLTTVPENIFSGCTAVTNFSYCFYGCSAVEGESPYTLIETPNSIFAFANVHLYDRADYPDYFTAPTSYSNCFTGSTFNDIDDIPSSWGGKGN